MKVDIADSLTYEIVLFAPDISLHTPANSEGVFVTGDGNEIFKDKTPESDNEDM
jgi:hypothetical protein